METACLLDVFDREMRCEYKGRVYRVRDNGAICRLHKEGCRASKCDDIWTFGTKNPTNGYMILSGCRVHQIVCTAFHGEAPYSNMVVDHIDTNRCNNRPENLRWLTRLENVLKNPITCARIANICGSVEAFIANPSILRGHERLNGNFSWMKTVTSEEARISYERMMKWANNPIKSQEGSLGEWIFQEHQSTTPPDAPMQYQPFSSYQASEEEVYESLIHDEETQSLTPNVVQINWKTPTEFLCCPQQFSGNPLEAYLANLEEGKVFCTNEYGDSNVLRYGIYQSELWVMCRTDMFIKNFAYTQITFKDGIFYHRNKGVYDIGDEPYKMFDMIIDGELG